MNDIKTLLPYLRLRFNMDHPNQEESYSLGYDACMKDLSEQENPFLKDSLAAQHWSEGWWDALEGTEPLFTLGKHDQDVSEIKKEASAITENNAANDAEYQNKNSIMSFVIEIAGAIAASAILGYQLFELVA